MTSEEIQTDDPQKIEAMSAAALKASKKQLRTFMKLRLSTISKESLEVQSDAVFESILKFPPYVKARRISVYLSMPGGEIQTDKIVQHALKNAKSVFVPYLYSSGTMQKDVPKKVMDMVKLRSLEDFQSLQRDSWGIPTIGAEGIELRERVLEGGKEFNEEGKGLDLMLMPGVAFEVCREQHSGMVKRLGHGKGFYDFFLHRYGEMFPAAQLALFGLPLKEQVLEDDEELHVPVGLHDHLLHGIVVGDGRIIESTVRK